MVIGPTGGGKTVLLNFLMAQAEKTGARQIFIDKDRGAQIFVLASGGTYLMLANGTPTGFAPLKALANTAEDRAWLSLWVRQLVRAEGRPITVQEERRIDDGIAAVMKLPRAARSLDALRTMLGMADEGGVGARLEKWTSRGALGWAFDNAEDEMTLDARFIGFDMTDFLDNADIRAPLMLYLFHRIDKMLTGDRTMIVIDEFWKALGDNAFRSFAQDGLKTYRKRNALMVFATQSPGDALKSDISHSILEQVATKIMLPNPNGQRRDYIDGFSMTDAEFALIREELSQESHKFLVKQGHDSVVVELDLTGLDNELAVLSGRAETTAVACDVIAEHGRDPAQSSTSADVQVERRSPMSPKKLRYFVMGVSLLTCMGSAHAQGIPVTDTRSLFQQLEQVRQGVSILAQGADQLQQARDLYRDLNKATDIGRVADSLRTDAMRELNVSSGSLDGYANGDLNVIGRLRGRSDSVFQGLMGQLSPDASESARASYETGARQAAVTAGLAGSVGDSVTSRRDGLEELRSRLGSANSAAERADMSARLQLEQAQMTNDMMALQAVELQRRAKAEAEYQSYLTLQQRESAKFRRQMGID
ncbi:hypothetical protein HNQ99_002955 [Rhizorhapis suberifaciens]|uniref:TraG P-loop domain-containing protein n=1 Tax=Rhizorhapis suberifaciens TaxID=13656 RepID=A0A840HYH3_9SPHN|nr:hypothetical protein [Rhizorhapis suberifaciens]